MGIGIDPPIHEGVPLPPTFSNQGVLGVYVLLPIAGAGLVCHDHVLFLGLSRCLVLIVQDPAGHLRQALIAPPAIDIDLITGSLPVTVVIVAIGSTVLSVAWDTAIRPLPVPGHVPAHCEPPVGYRRRFRD